MQCALFRKQPEVTVSKEVSSGENIVFKVNGTPVSAQLKDGKLSYTFTVTQAVNITYETTYTLSGSTEANAEIKINV